MKKFLVAMFWSIIFLFFSGCNTEIAMKESSTLPVTETRQTRLAISMVEGRNSLSKGQRKLYDDFYQKILRYEVFEIKTSNDLEFNYFEVQEVLDALRVDYPEFWLYLTSVDGDGVFDDNGNPIEISSLKIRYNYNWLIREEFSNETMNEILQEINEICDEIISRIPDGNLEQKYLFLAKELANRTTYVSERYFEEDEDVDWSYLHLNGPFLKGEGICQAYAEAYQYLCNRAGLWCMCVDGDADGPHKWNIVKLENDYSYYVDVTWGDRSNMEKYFLLTKEEIEVSHIIDKDQLVATGN